MIAGPRGIIYTPPTGEGSHPLDARQALELHGRRKRRDAPARADGGRAPPVRVDTPVRRRQRPDGPAGRPAYYRLLDSTRRSGDWEPWTLWTLGGVQETAEWIVHTRSGRPPSANEPSRGTATRGPERPSPTRRGDPARRQPALLPVDGLGQRAADDEYWLFIGQALEVLGINGPAEVLRRDGGRRNESTACRVSSAVPNWAGRHGSSRPAQCSRGGTLTSCRCRC